MHAEIGIIGGSGLYDMAELTERREHVVSTPFGEPSGPYVLATLRGKRVAFLARHGAGHRLMPSELNYRANIFGFKALGVSHILSASAVGSLKEEYRPLDLVFPDQFLDRTFNRVGTFFGNGLVAHVGFAHPLCERLRGLAADAAAAIGARVHRGGTYVCMEGPQFSTRAESHLYRSWGCDVVGMTNLQEAKLAREAELAYATLAMATDYDCWHEGHEDVTVDAILAVMARNVLAAKRIVALAAPRAARLGHVAAHDALRGAILTAPHTISPEARLRLGLLIDRHLPPVAR